MEDIKFEDALKNIQEPKVGQIINAQIAGINSEGVFVNIGMKSDGVISIEEFGTGGVPEKFKPGIEIPVVLLRVNYHGNHIVSYKRARQKSSWHKIQNIYKPSEPIEAQVTKKVKGGFTVDIGVDAFLPMSQLDTKTENIKDILNKKINVFVIELDDKTKNVVVSHRKFIELEKKRNIERIFSAVKQDDVIEGRVATITDFGAFIDIGGVDGLIHISDLAWHRVEKVKDILKPGQKLKVKVLKIDEEKHKISLGLKQLKENPWNTVEQKYPVDSTVRGKVISITDFGAFIEIEPGIEGLLHISELSWTDQIKHPKEIVKENTELELKVIRVDREKEKLSLSLKKMLPNPWEKVKENHPLGTKIKCKITSIAPFGAFAMLPEGIEGLVHLNDIFWMRKIKYPKELFSVGQEIETILLDVNPEQGKITLSIKHLSQDPFEKYAKGKIITGIVEKITNRGAFVLLENIKFNDSLGEKIEAFLHISEITLEKDKNLNELLNIGQEIETKVIKSDKDSGKIDISIRRLESDREREVIDKYSRVQAPKLGEILEDKDE